MKKSIPKKNYIIYSAIVLGTVLLVFYLSLWYKTIADYNNDNSVIVDIMAEISKDALPNYLVDNPDVVIYISSSSDEDIRSFDKKFKKYITDEEISFSMIYVNMSSDENNGILDILKDKYLSEKSRGIKKIVSPNLLFFDEGKIKDIMYTSSHKININDVKQFLKRNEVVE